MGAKVQCKNYLPGYFMGDLNEDANSGDWSHFCEEKVFKSAPYYNGFSQGHLDFNKDALKQTMLHHEATFRKQVCELHRLYGIQRDLMNEVQRKETNKYSISTVTSQSYPFSSQAPFEDTQKIWKIPSFVSSDCYAPSLSGSSNRVSPLNFLKESTEQAGSSLMQNGKSLNYCDLLDPKHKKLPKRTFDLQLPADEYINNEDEKGVGDEKACEISFGMPYTFNNSSGVELERDLKLTLGASGTLSSMGDSKKSDSRAQDTLHSQCLANLNEPIHGICKGETEASASIDLMGSTVCHEALQGQQPSFKPSLSSLSRLADFFQDNQKGKDRRTLPDILHGGNDGVRHALSFNCEPGQGKSTTNSFTPAFGHDKSTMSSESAQLDLKKAHELPPFLLFDQRQKETWSREKGAYGVDISNRCCSLTGCNYPGPPISSLYPATPLDNDSNTASPSISSRRKPIHSLTQSPVAVHDRPCFNLSAALDVPGKSSNSAIQRIEDTSEKWHLNGNSRSYTSCGSEIACQNGFNHPCQLESNVSILQFPLVGFSKLNPDHHNNSAYEDIEACDPRRSLKGLDYKDGKPAKDINLNSCLPNGFNDRVNHYQDLVCIDGERKHGDAAGGLSWLRSKVACNESLSGGGSSTQIDSGLLSGYSILWHDQDAEIKKYEKETRAKLGPANFVPIFGSALHSKDAESQRIEMIDSPSSKKSPNFPVLEKPHIPKDQGAPNSPFVSCWDQSTTIETSLKDGLLHFDLSCKLNVPDAERKLFAENPGHKTGIGNGCAGFRGDINLNSAAEACNEQPKSLEISYETDSEVPSASSIPRTTAKIRIEIDLEAPGIPEVEDIVYGAQPPQISQVVTPVHLSLFETETAQEPLAQMAAEVIVTMSSVVTNQLEKPGAMSSGVGNHLAKPELCSSSTSLSSPLQWFAELVSLNASDLKSMVGVSKGKGTANQEDSDGGNDFFEEMTLKLSETNVEEYCSKNWEQDNQRVEGTSTCPLLTRPRRGQARRGRQRRDFQRDILPGLASLSRHEVTEDLQNIGGLLRASGCSWQSGLSRRNAGRNGWNGQARGRKRLRGSASAGVGNLMTSSRRNPINSEMELEGISLQGWGKTTRRCRRQRCPTGNAAALLT